MAIPFGLLFARLAKNPAVQTTIKSVLGFSKSTKTLTASFNKRATKLITGIKDIAGVQFDKRVEAFLGKKGKNFTFREVKELQKIYNEVKKTGSLISTLKKLRKVRKSIKLRNASESDAIEELDDLSQDDALSLLNPDPFYQENRKEIMTYNEARRQQKNGGPLAKYLPNLKQSLTKKYGIFQSRQAKSKNNL
jgi:hypothetical protein